jgi:isoquinoline 1-oxidoreductase beta subunit
LGTTRDKVKVNTTLLGGGYGLRGEGYEAYDAVMLAKEVPGRPVKVMRTREDDMEDGLYRPLAAQRIDVGLDASGRILGWRHRIVSESVFARSQPQVFAKTKGVDNVVTHGGRFSYDVGSQAVEYVRAERGINVGTWRGIASSYTKFAIESVIDELAALAGQDAVAYRIALLRDEPRLVRVIETCAQMCGWTKARRNGRALGFAYSDAMSPTALAAEVSLDRASGIIKVHHVWTAVDPGVAVQPKNIVAQMEGSIVFGLGAALVEQINIQDGVVRETNLHQYRVLRMADIPPIDVQVLSTDNPATGVGEAGVPPVAPAIANALVRLTGKRLRHLPMLPERVKAALA